MIIWKETYGTGHPEIDSQHRMLFQFVNDLEEVLKEDRGESYFKSSFPFLESYAKAHFGFEEDCMFRRVCEGADRNLAAHKSFLLKVTQTKAVLNEKGYSRALLQELHQYLEGWVTGHILAVDVNLRSCAEGLR